MMFIPRQNFFNLQHTARRLCSTISLLNHNELQIYSRQLANEVVSPVASEADKFCKFPTAQINELGKRGFMGITAAEKYGGSNLDMQSVAIAVEEISRSCASTGAIVSIHNILYIDLLMNHGTEKQKEVFLKPFTRGTPGSFALSEVDAGSDVANISTTAVSGGNGFILNGQKSWVTSALQAEVAVIFATVDRKKKQKGITAFIVPLSTPGVQCSDVYGKLGIRGTSTCEISLTDTCVPRENVLGETGQGFKIAMKQLNRARIGIASQAVGIAQASLDTALKYVISRHAFGKRLADMQAVQLRLARMGSRIEAARLLVRKAAEMCDKNDNFIKMSSMAKLTASETATFCSHECIQLLGAMGYTNEMPAERLYRDARVTEIYGGVSDIQMMIIAEQLIKEFSQKC